MGTQSKEDRIRYRAYLMWLADGKPEGRDKEHWREAEAIVDQIPKAESERESLVDSPSTVPGQ